MLAVDDGEWEEAAALIARARSQVERYGLRAYATSAPVFAVSALVRARRGRVHEARDDLREAVRLQALIVDFAPWYEVQLDILLARAALRLSDVGEARRRLRTASRLMRRVPDGPGLREWLAEAWRRVEAFGGPANMPPAALTAAELRILRFLPTHMSFRQIGEGVHVSANTVKTQANAVYRKLDVSCRSDAVARARRLGLLDGAGPASDDATGR
jgi:LuxR family maltose regulon positive regulatory protein